MRLLFKGGFYSRAAFIGEFTVYQLPVAEPCRDTTAGIIGTS